jgi:hypothetical protein
MGSVKYENQQIYLKMKSRGFYNSWKIRGSDQILEFTAPYLKSTFHDRYTHYRLLKANYKPTTRIFILEFIPLLLFTLIAHKKKHQNTTCWPTRVYYIIRILCG